MYVQCINCLWEGYTSSLEVKPKGESKPMLCPECGSNEIVDREQVPDFPDDLLFGLSDDEFDEFYNLETY